MVTSTVLDNGVRILSERMPGVRSVSLGVWVNAGSRQDPADQLGIAHFTEHMLFKGTSKRSASQIAREIDALGGMLNAQTSKEYTVYYTKVLDEHLETGSDILFDLFLNSLNDPEEVEKEKDVVLQEIRMTEDTPDDYITDLFAEAFFHDSPLGTSILGTTETVGAFSREQVRGFLESFYVPPSIIVSAVGNVDHERLVDFAGKQFGDRRGQVLPQDNGTPRLQTGSKKAYYKDIEQVHITLGATGAAMNDERRWTYIVLNTVLGGSMSSMLFQEAREKLGLVYSIYSYLSSYRDCGVLGMYAAATPKNIHKTIEVIGRQMNRLRHGDLGDVSLEDVRTQIKGNLLLSRESTISRMSSLAKNEMYYNREVTVEEVIDNIQAVSMDDIVALANDIFVLDQITVVSLGKMKQGEMNTETLL